MEKISISHLMRFGFSGVAAYMALFYVAPEKAAHFAATTGLIGFPLALLAAGTGIYFVYSPLIYDLVLWPLVKGDADYRKFLHKRYSVDLGETDRLWRLIQRRIPPGENGEFRVWTSGVHLTFVSGLIALAAAFVAFSHDEPRKVWVLAVVSVISLAAAFRNNVRCEQAEFDRLRSLAWEDVDAIVQQFQRSRALEDG